MAELAEVVVQRPNIGESLDFILGPPDFEKVTAPDYMAQLLTHRGVITIATQLPDSEGGLEMRKLVRDRIGEHVETSLAMDVGSGDSASAVATALNDSALGDLAAEAIMEEPHVANLEPSQKLERVWAIIRRAQQNDPTLQLPEPLVNYVMFMAVPAQTDGDSPDTKETQFRDTPLITHTAANMMALSGLEPPANSFPIYDRLKEDDSERGVATERADELMRSAMADVQDHARQLFATLVAERDQYFANIERGARKSDWRNREQLQITRDILMDLVGKPDLIRKALEYKIIENNVGTLGAMRQLEVELILQAQGNLDDLRALSTEFEADEASSEAARAAVDVQMEIEILRSFRGYPHELQYALQMETFESDAAIRAAQLQHDHDLIVLAGSDYRQLRKMLNHANEHFYDAEMVREAKQRHDALLLEAFYNQPNGLERALANGRFYSQSSRDAARLAIVNARTVSELAIAN